VKWTLEKVLHEWVFEKDELAPEIASAAASLREADLEQRKMPYHAEDSAA